METATKPPEIPVDLLPVIQQKIDIEKAVELRRRGLSYQEIGTYFDCSKQAAHHALIPYTIQSKQLKDYKTYRADIYADMGREILTSIDRADIQKSSAYQRVGMVSLLHEKESLERGQATQIIRYDAQALRERYDELKRMLDETIDITPEDV